MTDYYYSETSNHPKVSVCITTYNHAAYIKNTLESVLMQQTTFEYEILIGDDCSTDNTRAILLEYKKSYPSKIKLHFQSKNVGVNRQDYDLIHLAKGEYIAWLDGDDYWITPDKLEKQASILDNHNEFSCVHTAWRDFHQSSGLTHDKYKSPQSWEYTIKGKRYVERFLLGATCGRRLSSTMYRRNIVIDFLSKDSDIYLTVPHLNNDFVLFCILAYYGPHYYLNEITTVYRILDTSLSHSHDEKKIYQYSVAYFYAVVHIIKYFHISHKIKQKSIHKALQSILPHIYTLDLKNDLRTIRDLCSQVNYIYTIGQYALIVSLKHPLIKKFTSVLMKLNNGRT